MRHEHAVGHAAHMALKDDARTADALRSRRFRSTQVVAALREALVDELLEHVLRNLNALVRIPWALSL